MVHGRWRSLGQWWSTRCHSSRRWMHCCPWDRKELNLSVGWGRFFWGEKLTGFFVKKNKFLFSSEKNRVFFRLKKRFFICFLCIFLDPYQKPQRFQKFLVRHFILRHSSHCELRYCWTTFVPLTAVLWEIGAIPTQTWPQIRISCWRAILVWKLMQRFTTILALPLEIQTLANLKHWQKLLYSETYMYTCIWFYDCICTCVCVFCFILGCFNQLLSLEFATSINIHWFNHCTPIFLNETFTANCNGFPFWGYIYTTNVGLELLNSGCFSLGVHL